MQYGRNEQAKHSPVVQRRFCMSFALRLVICCVIAAHGRRAYHAGIIVTTRNVHKPEHVYCCSVFRRSFLVLLKKKREIRSGIHL